MANKKRAEVDDLQAPNPPEQHNFLAMSGSYAIGNEQLSHEDYIKHLEDLRSKLLTRRRQLAFDAYKHSIVYMGRAIDISNFRPLISAVEEALADERSRH